MAKGLYFISVKSDSTGKGLWLGNNHQFIITGQDHQRTIYMVVRTVDSEGIRLIAGK